MITIKKLEWAEPSKETNRCWIAKCEIGTYSVVNENGWYAVLEEHAWGVKGFEWISTDLSKDTRQTAFDAAQADYSARILSAIETDPTPRAQALEPDFWSVHSKTGVHIGLWPIKAHAYEALREYEGGTITPLYRATHDHEEGFRQGIEAAAKLAEYFEETIYSEGMTEDVYYGISCTVSQVIREIRALSSQPVADALPQDVINLVIAAREGGQQAMKVNMNVKMSDDPKSCILAIEAVTREICRNTGRDPAEGTMMLLTAAVHMMNTYAASPMKDQATALGTALGRAIVAADDFFKLRGVPKPADNTNEDHHAE